MRRFGLSLLTILLILTTMFAQPQLRTQAAPDLPPQAEEVDPALEVAVQNKFTSGEKNILTTSNLNFKIDTVIPSNDREWALLWLAPVDPESGDVVATEPRIAIAQLTDPASDSWQIVLPTDNEWAEALDELPADLMPEQVEKSFMPADGEIQSEIQTVFRGYKLPWASGNQKRLSGSISHFLSYFSCPEAACRYAYDFADGTMFPLLASKGGIVDMYYDGCANGSTTCTNYLVLEDRSTTPTTWQIYYHLANGSIPSSLKKAGANVTQGQYIGNVDDTGYSSGHHLHFHVTNYRYTYETGYGQRVPWGYSVDIRFKDVSINDGTPRTCWEADTYPSYGTQCMDGNLFTSGNVGANPPSGSLTLPAAGEVVTGSDLLVAGTASDDLGVTKVQVIARGMDGIWRDIGAPLMSVPFTTSVDLCSAPVPDGPVDIALQVWDKEGNVAPGAPGLRTVVKNYACAPPPPECTLKSDNIILYAEPNYQGSCREYAYDASGTEMPIPDLDADPQVGNNNAASIQVGSNARAVLYTDKNFGGRSEALEANDPNLADNRVEANTLSSLYIQPRSQRVGDPTGFAFPPKDTDINPGPGDVIFPKDESLSVAMYAKGATSFKINLDRMEGTTAYPVISYVDLKEPVVSLGSLPAGLYSLRGWGYNSGGSNGTSVTYFTVDDTSISGQTPLSVPFTDELQLDDGAWQADGNWNHADLPDDRDGWQFKGYSDPARPINYGSLTSPPVELPTVGASYLRFSYRTVTESSYPFWDQRRVQISVDGGPFQDIQVVENGGAPHPQQKSPLWDDAQNWWLESPPIDLSAYASKTVRVRFYFFTADNINNTGDGWQIDAVSITTDPGETVCAESSRNDTLLTATQVSLGQSLIGQYVCPQGDVDIYKFNGTAGQRAAFRVEAASFGSNLDSYLYLLDSSGGLIVENDDIEYGVLRDSALGVVLPYTGTYYLKVKAWDHPQAGGSAYYYNLLLESDITRPSASIAHPDVAWIPGPIFDVSASANDTGSGVSQVDFYWHNPDWLNGTWEQIGSDADGSDGWRAVYDLSSKGNITNSGIYVEARDGAANTWGTLLTGIQIDSTKPVSQLNSLGATTGSTAVQLKWSASDIGSGLSEFQLQAKPQGNTSWQDWLPNLPGKAVDSWFLGQFGQAYEFRMRAIDKVGNLEDYPSNSEAKTTIEAACSSASDIYEQSGADNVREGAVPLPSEMYQEHNLCGLNDVDWVSFTGQANVSLFIAGVSLGGGAAVKLEIYNSAGELLDSFQAPGLGQNAVNIWTPPGNGVYYIKVTPLVEGLAGTDARYSLWSGPTKFMYLPAVNR